MSILIVKREIEYYTFTSDDSIIEFVDKEGIVYVEGQNEYWTFRKSMGEDSKKMPYAVLIENKEGDERNAYVGDVDWFRGVISRFDKERFYKFVNGVIDTTVH